MSVEATGAFAAALAARWPDLGLPAPALEAALRPALRAAAELRVAPGAALDPADAAGVVFVIEGELELRARGPHAPVALRRAVAPSIVGGDGDDAEWVAWAPTRLRVLALGPSAPLVADPGPTGHVLRRLLVRELSEGLLALNGRLGGVSDVTLRDRGHLDAASKT